MKNKILWKYANELSEVRGHLLVLEKLIIEDCELVFSRACDASGENFRLVVEVVFKLREQIDFFMVNRMEGPGSVWIKAHLLMCQIHRAMVLEEEHFPIVIHLLGVVSSLNMTKININTQNESYQCFNDHLLIAIETA